MNEENCFVKGKELKPLIFSLAEYHSSPTDKNLSKTINYLNVSK